MRWNKKFKRQAYHYGVQLVAVGGLTGFFAGVVVTLYNQFASMAEEFARGYYGFFRDNPAFIPMLFLALFVGAIITGGLMRFFPMVRGSGIPQMEGATRGLMRFSWYRALTGMFAASLFSMVLGIPVGSEGPSLFVGGSCGYGVSVLLRRGEMVRRYQITGGACAGLAVAFNAPLTGMAFAFEEAHKRFTPEIVICSFVSVIVGVLTRNLLREAAGLSVSSVFSSFSFGEFSSTDLRFYLYVLLAALVCGLAGVAFYKLMFLAKRVLSRISLRKGKLIIVFFLGGAGGLLTVYAMGGGREFIESLGSLSEGLDSLFFSSVWATLLIVVAVRIFLTAVNMGAGVPGGAFIPMLAIGAGLGGLMSLFSESIGMDPAQADALILICMAVFFTTVVKAPITGIVMVMELTWDYLYLLPVVIGVGIGYLVGDLFRLEPIYDKQLADLLEEQKKDKVFYKISANLRVRAGAGADGRAVRDVLWPSYALVTALMREGRHIIPDGKTVLFAGDEITVEAETMDRNEFYTMLSAGVGDILSSSEREMPRERDKKDEILPPTGV